ncbi:hypothetical protein A1O3_09939 [Capronia epimyces CBS 606.96]|uniref:Protein kinase domain-containing protein n=1 Tax=Capronia epimyces CBS 606.96 TaxID=1182542 RepID=W9XK27_9EURO|nr:uncharacterized protein A1O3_09939 [Capronia epimyces CBS 606.96]EXJ77710.1 hypothetical protein A1O3_09939 [Capronia epimyces CBS 606.96]
MWNHTHRSGFSDIKPQNILLETAKINNMFEHAPSTVFRHSSPALAAPDDFYMESEQVFSADEDLSTTSVPPGFAVRLADFGTASWVEKHLCEWIQPPSLRAPEVIIGAGWGPSVDIWNLGCVIWELAEGKVLFDGCPTPSAPYSAHSHLAQMQALFGPMPKHLLRRSTNAAKYFDSDGNPLSKSPFPPSSLEGFVDNPELIADADKEDFVDLITSMLKLAPEERLDAKDLLNSKWLN